MRVVPPVDRPNEIQPGRLVTESDTEDLDRSSRVGASTELLRPYERGGDLRPAPTRSAQEDDPHGGSLRASNQASPDEDALPSSTSVIGEPRVDEIIVHDRSRRDPILDGGAVRV